MKVQYYMVHMLLHNTIRWWSYVVQWKMLNTNHMSVILILTNGIICHHQAITMVFLGGQLVIIGGHLSYTQKRTNKVSAFDEDGQT